MADAVRIESLVNNAGANMLGAVEATDIPRAPALSDVNFLWETVSIRRSGL